MNPWSALIGQTGWLAGSLALLSCFDSNHAPAIAAAMSVATLVHALCLVLKYAVDQGGRPPRSDRRRQGDLLVLAQVIVIATVPYLVLGLQPSGGFARSVTTGRVEIGTLASASAVMAFAVYNSSMWDWWYIKPRIDGVVWDPPCQTAENARWHRVTKTWLRHRLIAELTFAISIPVTAALVLFQLTSEAGDVWKWITRAAGLGFTLGNLAARYSWKRIQVGMLSVNRSQLPFRLGSTVSWSMDARYRSHPLIERVKRVLRRVPGLRFLKVKEVDQTVWEGRSRYVLTVALDNADVVAAASRAQARGVPFPPESVPMAPLLVDGVVTEARSLNWCTTKRRGCLGLNPSCERLPASAIG